MVLNIVRNQQTVKSSCMYTPPPSSTSEQDILEACLSNPHTVVSSRPQLDAQSNPGSPACDPRSDSATEKKKKKKKKKKDNFKNIMNGILIPSTSEEDRRKSEMEKLRSHLGGGHFSKLDKI